MVTRDTAWPHGVPCWVDLGVEDMGKATAFYSRLFGWDVRPGAPETGGYAMCRLGDHTVAGIGPKQSPAETPPVWTTYIATDDVDATAQRIPEAGGTVLLQPGDVLDAGRMAIAADPGGAVFGLWQARAHIGYDLANEPGSVCWNENMSRNFDGNKAFYRALFGYEYGDMSSEDFRYATLDVAGRPAGGIGELGPAFPAEIPPHWACYFAVPDADAAVATVSDLDGIVRREPWDTPYGRMAVVSDNQGATFSVIGVPSQGTSN